MNIINNTILVPYHDSLVDSHQLPEYDLTGELGKVADPTTSSDNNVAAYIKVNDRNSVRIIGVQEIQGFSMERENEQRPSMNGDYIINLPGVVKYNTLRIKHILTREKFFLDWMMNGVTKGGVSRADIEIVLQTALNKRLIFTLYDAFPVSWRVTDLTVGISSDVMLEMVDFVYSSVSFKAEAAPANGGL